MPPAYALRPVFRLEPGGSQPLLPGVEEPVPDHQPPLERDQLRELLLPLHATRTGLAVEAAEGQHPVAEVERLVRPDLPGLECLREPLESLDQTLVAAIAVGESERLELGGDLPQ